MIIKFAQFPDKRSRVPIAPLIEDEISSLILNCLILPVPIGNIYIAICMALSLFGLERVKGSRVGPWSHQIGLRLTILVLFIIEQTHCVIPVKAGKLVCMHSLLWNWIR